MFFGHFWPTYPNQILYYISLFTKIRWSLTYLSTYLKIWRHMWMLPNRTTYERSKTWCTKLGIFSIIHIRKSVNSEFVKILCQVLTSVIFHFNAWQGGFDLSQIWSAELRDITKSMFSLCWNSQTYTLWTFKMQTFLMICNAGLLLEFIDSLQ